MKNQKGAEISGAAYRAIYFAQPLSLRNLSEFFRIPQLLLAQLESDDVDILEKRGKAGVQQILEKIEDSILNNREIINLSENKELLPPEVVAIVKSITGILRDDELVVTPGLSGLFDYVQKSNRTTEIEIKNIRCSKTSEFLLRSSFNLYWEERYSLAWRGDDISLSLFAASAARGGKGQARLLIKILTEDALYLDDAAKYINTEAFLRNINI